tara:strand:- start:1265 stop:1486 length:222 start_codon:yes stop_codon:yes gene_type:complete
MGIKNGVDSKRISISGDRAGDRLLQGVERRMKNSRPIAPEKQEKIDQILFEMKNSSDRMQKLLEVFSRINRRL